MYSTRCNRNKIIKVIVSAFLFLNVSITSAMEVPIYDFPIKSYIQDIKDHFPPDSVDYSAPLLKPDYQVSQLHQFITHYYASDATALSPWSEKMVTSVLPFVKKSQLKIIDEFDNQSKAPAERHYAENFKEHDEVWLEKIKQNMVLDALDTIEFKEENKAIATTNTFARALPEGAPDFYHASLPGQGFPFDNLQEAVIWSGTPLYIFSVSQDKAWSLVLTPDAYFAWVKSSDIALASNKFIQQWQAKAQQGLIAITKTDTSVLDKQQRFQFKGYIGAVFPLVRKEQHHTFIWIPVKNEHQQAMMRVGVINTEAASLMPLVASKKNMAKLIKELQNRPYGWGGAFFFNDCSQEMKSIFTPFGIWLPRNSAQQAQLNSTLDLSSNTLDERIELLKTKGHPLMTLIYIEGHVMLYVGTHGGDAMTYQNLWGLAPANRDKRYVVGQAIFLPLLKHYPENADISSPASKATFKLVYLDELNAKLTPQAFAASFSVQNAIENGGIQ